jgi:hypothetical protein
MKWRKKGIINLKYRKKKNKKKESDKMMIKKINFMKIALTKNSKRRKKIR